MIALFYSCVEEVDPIFELYEPKLVVASTLFPDELVRVRVTRSAQLLEEDEYPVVRDATVTLFQRGNTKVEDLIFVEEDSDGIGGYYTTQSFRPSPGVEYTFHVAAPGFDLAVAVSSIPPPVPINLLAVNNLSKSDVQHVKVLNFDLAVDYDDPAGEVNFYNLRLAHRPRKYMIAFNGDTIIRDPGYFVPISVANSPDDEWFPAVNNGGILFRDKPGSGALLLELESRINRDSLLIGDLFAELRSVSADYYQYQQDLRRRQDGANPISAGPSQPVIIHSNVSNGLGLVAGYTSYSESIPIEED